MQCLKRYSNKSGELSKQVEVNYCIRYLLTDYEVPFDFIFLFLAMISVSVRILTLAKKIEISYILFSRYVIDVHDNAYLFVSN